MGKNIVDLYWKETQRWLCKKNGDENKNWTENYQNYIYRRRYKTDAFAEPLNVGPRIPGFSLLDIYYSEE
jgi:hypothetical protein